jgi:hypothetical protein
VRDIILNNFWWKVTALLLAILAWLGFQPSEMRPNLLPDSLRPYFTRHLIAHPVTISKSATDTREFKVTPAEVDITLSGDEKVLRNLVASEVRAEVLMSEYKGQTNMLRIHVFVPPRGGIKLERLTPERVQVEVLKE